MNRFQKKLYTIKDNSVLQTKLAEMLSIYFNLRMQLKTGQLKQSHLLKESRRNIALIKTLISKNSNVSENKT